MKNSKKSFFNTPFYAVVIFFVIVIGTSFRPAKAEEPNYDKEFIAKVSQMTVGEHIVIGEDDCKKGVGFPGQSFVICSDGTRVVVYDNGRISVVGVGDIHIYKTEDGRHFSFPLIYD